MAPENSGEDISSRRAFLDAASFPIPYVAVYNGSRALLCENGFLEWRVGEGWYKYSSTVSKASLAQPLD